MSSFAPVLVPARRLWIHFFASMRFVAIEGLAGVDRSLRMSALPGHDGHIGNGSKVCPYGRKAGEPCPECEADRDELYQW